MLFSHPQLWPGLLLSVLTGGIATLLALAMAVVVLAGLPAQRMVRGLAAAGLALPHLAFAIGFGFLIMPSGLIARLVAGGDAPPGWITVQDPWGVSLTAALALKELPFLLTAAVAALARGDAAGRLAQECRAAASLGHGAGSAWLRIVLPQLLHDLRWPLVIVFVYGATVVDMALVLGPTQPPTLAVTIWHALNDADAATNRMGLAMSSAARRGAGRREGPAERKTRCQGRVSANSVAAAPSGAARGSVSRTGLARPQRVGGG
ncbi:MAG: hypothetical protein ACKOED_17070 [Aestuariivirga sp.]|uniref:hypothetical protein n=1 Tax=Aestuariivirga sp. TaxID=2650926 RepID=UPI0038D073F5